MRGEHEPARASVVVLPGSAPHVGGPQRAHGGAAVQGISLPHSSTGKTPAPSPSRRDQPRGYGEHRGCVAGAEEIEISPPNVRGTRSDVRGARQDHARRLPQRGISPARAGSMSPGTGPAGPCRDQPRTREEHVYQGAAIEADWGSALHVWERWRGCQDASRPGGSDRTGREQRSSSSSSSAAFGSAPRTRGASGQLLPARGEPGISPACARSTPSCPTRLPRRRDQPRTRGEHKKRVQACSASGGSAPHARGALRLDATGEALPGVSSARAGSATLKRPRCCGTGDQPHMSGEHGRIGPYIHTQTGSAPHARGTPILRSRIPGMPGISPAHAGSTVQPDNTFGLARDQPCTRGSTHRRPGSRSPGWDQPRMCGEHSPRVASMMSRLGSALHTRGSTPWARWPASRWWDQPRMGGECGSFRASHSSSTGSFPHSRGARPEGWPGTDVQGISPAPAGSTAAPGPTPAAGGDQPRTRGEHGTAVQVCGLWPGSASHARGAPQATNQSGAHGGISPARAGSTARPSARATPLKDQPRTRGEHRRRHVLRDRLRGISLARAGSTSNPSRTSAWPRDQPRTRGEHGGAVWTTAPQMGSAPHARGARRCGNGGPSGRGISPARAESTRSG